MIFVTSVWRGIVRASNGDVHDPEVCDNKHLPKKSGSWLMLGWLRCKTLEVTFLIRREGNKSADVLLHDIGRKTI